MAADCRSAEIEPDRWCALIGSYADVQTAFEQGLADFGYVVGQNISLVLKNATGNSDRLNQLAAELVAAKVDVIFGWGSQATSALRRQTNRIPIVMTSTNPVGLGFVASLARPGGNITGLSLLGPEVAAKRLQLLKELTPEAVRAAILWNPDPGAQFSLADIDIAFSAATKEGVQAVVLLPAPFIGRNAGRIAELALANRLPTLAFDKAEVKAGELLSFGPVIPAAMRRAAYFVDRILKGASPSDLPVEQPIMFELVINLKTAKTLGLDIPPTLLARADEVIE
jgi:putative tryptophan/tyrosine transport system substrate-binding protein